MIIFAIKAVVIILGTIAVLYFFIAGLSGKKGYRKALVSLVAVFVIITLLTILDFGTVPKIKKERVLIARREAPVTGIELILYNDSTFSLGNMRKITNEGVYRLKKDTLLLEMNASSDASFLIKHKTLEELGKTGIGLLNIELNKLAVEPGGPL